MLGDDPTWSVECSHGREKADGPGLQALIKAFFLILATVAVLELWRWDTRIFRPICCPVSQRRSIYRQMSPESRTGPEKEDGPSGELS